MPYQDMFVLFWKMLQESVQEGSFAKLTMAKTVGKLELKNIFLRPVYSDGDFKVLLKYHYRPKEVEDKEEELSLEDAFQVLKTHLKNPFFSVLLFTTKKDVTFKVNKKGVGSITNAMPSFSNVTPPKTDIEK